MRGKEKEFTICNLSNHGTMVRQHIGTCQVLVGVTGLSIHYLNVLLIEPMVIAQYNHESHGEKRGEGE